AGRLGHAFLGLHQLAAHLAAAAFRDAEITVGEEIAAARGHCRRLGARVNRLHTGGYADWRNVVSHLTLRKMTSEKHKPTAARLKCRRLPTGFLPRPLALRSK